MNEKNVSFSRWENSKKKWVPRVRKVDVISRVYTVSPRYAERFAIRLLSMNVRGATSFEALRTLDDGTVCATFVEAARVILCYTFCVCL